MELAEILRAGFPALGLTVGEAQLSDFCRFADLLEEKNRVMNLTAIQGPEDTARLHFLDCCALLSLVPLAGKTLVDVGTGAGFPGLPLKLACPDLRLTLVDSQRKRVDFLRETVDALGLEDVTCLHLRAEEAPRPMRETYDAAVSRAVARLNVLCELCLPFVKVGGQFLAMKGPDCGQEVAEAANAIGQLGGDKPRILTYTVPGTDVSHSVVCITKCRETPEIYPRRFARITKSPL